MNWPKIIFMASVGIIFVGASFVSIFGAGNLLNSFFKTYVLKYQTCNYLPQPAVLQESNKIAEPRQNCKVDYNQAKGDISGGFSMLIIGFPVALVMFRELRLRMREYKEV